MLMSDYSWIWPLHHIRDGRSVGSRESSEGEGEEKEKD